MNGLRSGVVAIELSRRDGLRTHNCVTGAWAMIGLLLAGALRVAPGRTETVLAAWPLERRPRPGRSGVRPGAQ